MKTSDLKKMIQEELSIALDDASEKDIAPVVPWETVKPNERGGSPGCCKVPEPTVGGSDCCDKTKKVISILKLMKLKDPETADFNGKNVILGRAMRGDVFEYVTHLRDCKSGEIKRVPFGKLIQ